MNYKKKNELFKKFQEERRILLKTLNKNIYELRLKQLEDDYNALVKLETHVTALTKELNYLQTKKNKPITRKIKDARDKHKIAKKNRTIKVRLALRKLKEDAKIANKQLRDSFKASLKSL